MSRWIGVLTLFAFGCAACGGEAPQAPVGPSNTGAVSVTQGARILGNVSAGVPLGAMAAQVVGTEVSSHVGSSGGFTLDGVPAGPVQLRFVGSGVDASVALSPVLSGDVVSLLVGVAGATATIQSESRNAGGKIELEGRIESITPADSSLIVAGRPVTTTAATVFRDGNSATKAFADLAVGQRVHVRGTLATDAIAADLITTQNTNVSIPVNVNGAVEGLAGDVTAFEFLVGSRKVKGDSATVFYGDSALLGFSALKEGSRVEVKGEQRDGYVYAVRIHINGGAELPQDDSASVEGRLVTLTGTAPALVLTIAATGGEVVVTTTGSTEVQRRGDVQTLADLAIGQTIHAVGARQPDRSIIARKLQIKDDEPSGAFVIEGSLGGLKGTCPAISFGVNGYSITASSDTKYFPEPSTKCEDLKSGTKVIVAGIRQADGSVKAEAITRK